MIPAAVYSHVVNLKGYGDPVCHRKIGRPTPGTQTDQTFCFVRGVGKIADTDSDVQYELLEYWDIPGCPGHPPPR
jgi:hypothetical protein